MLTQNGHLKTSALQLIIIIIVRSNKKNVRKRKMHYKITGQPRAAIELSGKSIIFFGMLSFMIIHSKKRSHHNTLI